MLEIQCPNCAHRYEVEDRAIGQHGHCPKCNHRLMFHEAPHAPPFRGKHGGSPSLTLTFYLIVLITLGGIGAALAYFALALFKKDI